MMGKIIIDCRGISEGVTEELYVHIVSLCHLLSDGVLKVERSE